jgi:hypothetical protein
VRAHARTRNTKRLPGHTLTTIHRKNVEIDGGKNEKTPVEEHDAAKRARVRVQGLQPPALCMMAPRVHASVADSSTMVTLTPLYTTS